MSKKLCAMAFAVALTCGFALNAASLYSDRQFRQAVRLYERGMYERSKEILSLREPDALGEGYALLCDLRLKAADCSAKVNEYRSKYGKSALNSQIHYLYGLILFDDTDYANAYRELSAVDMSEFGRKDTGDILFKKYYSKFALGEYAEAKAGFMQVEKMGIPSSAYPARFAIGYIDYINKDFNGACKWLEKSLSDPQFKDAAEYYILESRFMLGDTDYVLANGEKVYKTCTPERKSHLARILSETYLVQGDTGKAKQYYDSDLSGLAGKNRADLFYAGSLQYSLQNYADAVANFSQMPARVDSVGQIANYQMGYSYIQLKNKVSAMEAFRDASKLDFDKRIKEDAFFNFAKLAFDLHHSTKAFEAYLKLFPNTERKDQIYSYIAVGSLQNQDYAAAIEAYDNIDELTQEMKSNYMKANYLRARQLIGNGAYSDAIPCLKASTFFTSRQDNFNKLARYWLAESYYKTENYDEAISVYTDLYNNSALENHPEGRSIPYNLGYAYFMNGNYASASNWFGKYISGSDKTNRKDALIRKADCDFIRKNYKDAISGYNGVLLEYNDRNNIYPYYQLGLCYGLTGDNAAKINALNKVRSASPDADFYSDALYELGRSYVTGGNDNEAISCFETLKSTSRDTTFIAKSLLELGMISRNRADRETAMRYYKQVVENFPSSGYREDALLAIESLYQASGEPDKYLAYIESLSNPVRKTDSEKELLYFNTGEQLYLNGSYQKAVAALENYIGNYPRGERVQQACFYLADSHKNLGNKEKACDYYAKVADMGGDGSFVELSLLTRAQLSYSLEKYADSYDAYNKLLIAAKFEDNRFAAKVGMMEASFMNKDFNEAINAASRVKLDAKAGDNECRRADYVRAMSYLGLDERTQAMDIFRTLSSKPATDEGAEASYLLIQDTYDRGDFDSVESMVYKLAEKAPGQSYWLARSFLVLGDSFVEKGNLKQAKATFESLRDGYAPSEGESDDVVEGVRMRLAKLNEMM